MPIPSSILSNLFEKPFSMDHFVSFIGELFNCTSTLKIKGPFPVPTFDGMNYNFAQLLIDQNDIPLHKQIDIVVIEFLDTAKNTIEKARAKQRNIISNHLKTYAKGKNNVLAVFWSKNDESWRWSYVKQDFKVIEENGKKKVTDELSPAKRFSFFIEPSNSRNVTVKKNFIKLLDDKVSPSISDIEMAFSVEAVTNDFFNNYKLNYQELLTLFQGDKVFQDIQESVNHGDEHFAENFVKKLMGQIVFLYFLQKKGWIGVEKDKLWGSGSHSYMRDLHNECVNGGDNKKENGGVNYFNDYLEHLFYATLNEKRDNHWSDYFNIKIPYLNGGLFEPINGYSWQGPEHIIFKGNEKKANKVFGDLLDFFDQYNFTVYENDPLEQDVAVDPEMLGKIFENLLPENERKGKGSFYTPREIVHYMCKESIKQYLITKTGLEESRIDRLIRLKDSMETTKRIEKKETSGEQYQKYLEFEQDANKIDTALSSVRIIDPAVGSGAFPMGILKEIVTLRTYIKRNILLNDDPDLQYNLKKEALENCIYGVDIDPGAVEIAKLRFWLSLVIENDSQNIETLPNLDYKIMQGNSLVEQLVIGESVIDIITDDDLKDDTKVNKKLANVGGASLFDSQLESSHLIQKIKFLHKKFFLAKTPEDKKSLKKEIDLIEKSLIRAGCEQEINRIKSQLDNLTLKTTVTGAQLTDKEHKLVVEYEQTIAGIKDLEAKFEKDNIRPFFPWKLHFGEIFKERGGFDIVIGNPPYIRIHKQGFELKKYLKENYYSANGDYDYYVLFYELAVKILCDQGVYSFITPDKFLVREYGKNIRELLLKNKIHEIFDLSRATDLFDASVYPLIFIGKKIPSDTIIDIKIANTIENLYSAHASYNLKVPTDSDLKIQIIDPSVAFLIDKINLKGQSLGDLIGVNNLFCGTPRAKDYHEWANNMSEMNGDSIGKDSLKVLVCGSITPYGIHYGKKIRTVGLHLTRPVFNNHNGIISGNKWEDFNLSPKILIRGNDKRITAALDITGSVFIGVYGIKLFDHEISSENYLYWLGVINSKLTQWVFGIKNPSIMISGEYFSINSPHIIEIKVPIINSDKEKNLMDQIIKYVKQINEIKLKNADGDIFNIETLIDHLVYHLYELTYDEVKIVDPEFALSKESYENFTW